MDDVKDSSSDIMTSLMDCGTKNCSSARLWTIIYCVPEAERDQTGDNELLPGMVKIMGH